MKPYAFNPVTGGDVGCCPGHDSPRCYRWAGRYSSKNSRRTDTKDNTRNKRTRRRTDKHRLKNFEDD